MITQNKQTDRQIGVCIIIMYVHDVCSKKLVILILILDTPILFIFMYVLEFMYGREFSKPEKFQYCTLTDMGTR